MDAVAKSGGVGASISVTGLVVASPAKGQSIEVHATTATVLGAVYGGDNGEIGGKNYPMAKKQHGLEFLREKAHLRPRSKMFSSAMRMRHAMAYATHKFFNDRGFVYTHTPLITAADCEGASPYSTSHIEHRDLNSNLNFLLICLFIIFSHFLSLDFNFLPHFLSSLLNLNTGAGEQFVATTLLVSTTLN